MGETGIEWVKNADGSQGRTWNPIRGCTRVSPGCGGPGPHGGCYAEVIAARFSGPGLPYHGIAEMRGGKARWTGKLAFVEEKLTEPLKVRKPTTWFVNSMSDLFHESVPDAWIDRVFAVMALCPQHNFQVLTKRSARMRDHCARKDERGRHPSMTDAALLAATGRWNTPPLDLRCWPLPNVWLGVSAEDQRRADERVPDLLATPAAVRFVSAEPLLGPLNLSWAMGHPIAIGAGFLERGRFAPGLEKLRRLDWIIVGGESGPGARPMHPDWARQIRDACAAAGVAYLFKQHGAWLALSQGAVDDRKVLHQGTPDGRDVLYNVGKKAAGRLLDGVTHDAMPEVRHG